MKEIKTFQGKTLHWTKRKISNNKTLHLTELGKKKKKKRTNSLRSQEKERKKNQSGSNERNEDNTKKTPIKLRAGFLKR